MDVKDSYLHGSIGVVKSIGRDDEGKLVYTSADPTNRSGGEIPDFVGADSNNNGKNGLVPAPTKSNYNSFLRGDGTWYDIGKYLKVTTLNSSAFSSIHESGITCGYTANEVEAVKGDYGIFNLQTSSYVSESKFYFLQFMGNTTNPNLRIRAYYNNQDGEGTLYTAWKTVAYTSDIPDDTTYTLSGSLDTTKTSFGLTLTSSSGTVNSVPIPVMTGATSTAAGAVGLVPQPAANKYTSFLRGDGTWAIPTNTTYSVFTGATASAAGTSGLVPAPSEGNVSLFLRSNGSWSALPSQHLYVGAASTVSNLNNSKSETSNGYTYIKLFTDNTLLNQYKIYGRGNTTVTSDVSGDITINTTVSWDSIDDKPDTFTPSLHTHPTSEVNSLTGYTIATTASDLTTTDSLNTALGKLEYKSTFAYDWINATISSDNDSNTNIDRLYEVYKVLEGINETDTITNLLGKYLPLTGGTMNSNAYIAWNSGSDGNDVNDWGITNNGLRIISSTSENNTTTPTQYATALHVKGRYGFLLASRGGKDANDFYIKNVHNTIWNKIATEEWVKSLGYTTNQGTITEITANAGLTGGGTSGAVTIGHSNSVTAVSTSKLCKITYDAQGHITGNSDVTAADIPKLEQYAVYAAGSASGTHALDATAYTTAIKHIGYGYLAKGWSTTGPAMSFGANTGYLLQIQGSTSNTGNVIYRTVSNKTPGAWYTFIDTHNYSLIPTFLKASSDGKTGNNGLVPMPDYNLGSATRFLREDGVWVNTPDYNTWRAIRVGGNLIASTSTASYALNFAAGSGISLTTTAGSSAVTYNTITITNSGVRSVSIGTGNYSNNVAVNTDGTTTYLTIPYATTASQLNNTSVTNADNACLDDTLLGVKWYAQINAVGDTGSKTAGTNGFPAGSDANGILWLGVHPGNSSSTTNGYGGQLGISSNGNLYFRFKNAGTFASWKQIAWTSQALNPETIITNSTYTVSSKEWTNTVEIKGKDTGTYLIQLTLSSLIASGVMSILNNYTDGVGDEIPLHVYGATTWRPYLRTYNGYLLIASNDSSGKSRAVTIKIVKLL